jgi:hypothetical protein
MKLKLWITLTASLAYCIDKELWKVIDYLKEQVRVLREQQERNKRILLNNYQRIRLSAIICIEHLGGLLKSYHRKAI